MKRPELRAFPKPKHIKDYPAGPCYEAGYLVTDNAGWRSEKPVVDLTKCTGCNICYMSCPDGVVFKENGKVAIDYLFCKGCGICAKVCRSRAIGMVREGGEA
jgi:pyruvate ferredoxin oxidoreductase delta subunit